MIKRLIFLTLALLAACQPESQAQSFTKGDEVAFYDFAETGSFEEGTYAEGAVRLQVRDGVYRMELLEGDGELWYGQWGAPLRDVVIDVEAQQFTESANTAYGVMCRARGAVGQVGEADPGLQELAAENIGASSLIAGADATEEATAEAEATEEATAEATADSTAEATQEATAEATAEGEPQPGGATILNLNNGDGYLFMIEGNGRFAILRARGRSVSALVDWTSSGAIQAGAAANRIRAVCLGDYLALYINGEFMGSAIDDTYNEGQVGLAAAGTDRLGMLVEFDNLSVSAAEPGE